MFLGNLHQSNVIILLRLFFGAVGVGFAVINETQYALVSLIIAAIIGIFTYRLGATFERTEITPLPPIAIMGAIWSSLPE